MHRVVFIFNIPLLIVVLVSYNVLAAGTQIEGSVKDAKTGNPLPGADVILVGTSIGAASDMNGEYNIQNVPIGTYTLKATFLGYKSQEYKIEVKNGLTVVQNFELLPAGIKGETVVVTAQASGQSAAINQQLSSMQIKNVVSSARIQELPDANAAESVGRLPGVSLIREGGEGSQVVIRGLAPKYNLITIDGVQIPGNVSTSRAVDLSMISSSMLGGIEVTKAITPDMDAAALGGTVNFDLRVAKNSPKGLLVHLLAQDNYNNLQDTYGGYKFVGSAESRFYHSHFGIFAQINVERRNLTSNELGASYSLNAPVLNQTNPVYLDELNLTDIPRIRQRYGAMVVMDYKQPDMKIALMNFGSLSDTKSQSREESYSLLNNTHDYITSDQHNKLNVIMNLLDFRKTFQLFTVDARLSHSYSENVEPATPTFDFQQDNVGISGSVVYRRLNPQKIPSLALDNLSKTYLYRVDLYNSFSRNRKLSGSVDFTSNIDFSREITSVLKFGGQYKYTVDSYNYDDGNGSIQQEGHTQEIQAILNAFPWMKNTVPPNSFLPITVFVEPNYSYGNFLGGDYQMGAATNIGLMDQVMNVIKKVPFEQAYYPDSYKSIRQDYNGNEYESAAYIMSTIKFGSDITFLPGVRYQQLETSYTAPRGFVTTSSRMSYDYRDTTTKETHGFWLPMVTLIYKPFTWLQLHLAYTNTLTYPSFNAITPRMDVGQTSVIWNNYALKPSHSTNYDAVFAIYDNNIGLFTVDAFSKHINDLIFPVSRYITDPTKYPGVPNYANGSSISTYINNPYAADLWGLEFNWQTHFWYLPDPLSGLVLNVNYTHIFSQAKYPRTTVKIIYLPTFKKIINNTFYTDRLIYQPDNIANLAVGYDYKGFSARISMLLQSNVFEQDDFWPELRVNTAKYVRWDLSVKQNLPWYGLQVFFDINNINEARDTNLNQGSTFPQSEQFYDMTADMGLRWSI